MFTNEQIERLIVSFLKGKGKATEAEIQAFVTKCEQAVFTAELIKRAANGEFGIGWSDQENNFLFGLTLKNKPGAKPNDIGRTGKTAPRRVTK
jgi:hypothetical protein